MCNWNRISTHIQRFHYLQVAYLILCWEIIITITLPVTLTASRSGVMSTALKTNFLLKMLNRKRFLTFFHSWSRHAKLQQIKYIKNNLAQCTLITYQRLRLMKHSYCYGKFYTNNAWFSLLKLPPCGPQSNSLKISKNNNHNRRDIMHFHHLLNINYHSKTDEYLCQHLTHPKSKSCILLRCTLGL